MVGGMTLLTKNMVDSLCCLCIYAGVRKGRILFCSNGKFKKQTTKNPTKPGSACVTSIIYNEVRGIL